MIKAAFLNFLLTTYYYSLLATEITNGKGLPTVSQLPPLRLLGHLLT
jgi:hypothetical protein